MVKLTRPATLDGVRRDTVTIRPITDSTAARMSRLAQDDGDPWACGAKMVAAATGLPEADLLDLEVDDMIALTEAVATMHARAVRRMQRSAMAASGRAGRAH